VGAASDAFLAARRYSDLIQATPYDQMLSRFVSLSARAIPTAADSDGSIQKMIRTAVVTSTSQNIEALAGAGQLDDAKSLIANLIAFDGSEATRQKIQSHLDRAGQSGLLLSPDNK